MRSVSQLSFTGWIGAGRRDITPPIGIYSRNWGAAAHETAEGIHRPLTATALTLQTDPGGPPMVIVSMDLGWWRTREDEWYLRGGLIDAHSLDLSQVMIAFTHTHSGPSICREDSDRPGGDMIAFYLDHVRDMAIEAVGEALQSRVPAELAWTYGRCDLARHRDLPDPERPRVVCGFDPDGPSDDTLLVGRVSNDEGNTIATIVNYACHPVTLAWENRLISPDFVGAMREVVEGATDGAPCLFLQGASGELGPREQYSDDPSLADLHGRQIGYAVLSAMEGMLPPATELRYAGVVESGAPLATWSRVPKRGPTIMDGRVIDVELLLQPMPSAGELEAALEKCTDRVEAERIARKRRVRRSVGDGETATMPCWIWRLGDSVWVGHPNEAYSDLQIELRRRFPSLAVIAMNVANGHIGYLPPARLYGQDIYQVWQSPFGPGGLERLIEAASGAIEEMNQT